MLKKKHQNQSGIIQTLAALLVREGGDHPHLSKKKKKVIHAKKNYISNYFKKYFM